MKKFLLSAILLFSFFSGYSQSMNCGSFCVLSISNLDTLNNEIDVTIYNGDTNHVNYPTVVLVNTMGDTIANIDNYFYLFAQIPGDTVVHTIPTDLDSLPSPLNCFVYLTDQIWDTTCMFSYPMSCTVGITEYVQNVLKVYPNPAAASTTVVLPTSAPATITISNMIGQQVSMVRSNSSEQIIDVSDLPAGIYLLRVEQEQRVFSTKLIRQ
jgi:hypothetical protein